MDVLRVPFEVRASHQLCSNADGAMGEADTRVEEDMKSGR